MKHNINLLLILSTGLLLSILIGITKAEEKDDGSFLGNVMANAAERLRQLRERFWTRLGDRMNLRDGAFESFRKLYNKTYSASELRNRFRIYTNRLNFIEQWNKLYEQGKVSYSLKANHLADWTDGELLRLNGLKMQPNDMDGDENDSESSQRLMSQQVDRRNLLQESLLDDGLPHTKDWRNTGTITSVRDQMHCGAAYAATALDLVEAMDCVDKDGKPKRPAVYRCSLQQIIDCGPEQKNATGLRGCNGGSPTAALEYINKIGVMVAEEDYDFTGREGKCRNTTNMSPFYFQRWNKELVTLRSEADFQKHVAKHGPIIALMHASTEMNFYESGVFNDPTCTRVKANHPILIVGYGIERGRPYWLLKNSWGTEWGMNGYMKIARGRKMCKLGSIGWGYVKKF